ncbi:MAG: hypothetical protein ABIM89_16625 [Mycobacteriales bacterium]
MAERNRVTPFGEIDAIDQRGLFLGNRGCIHRGREIVRPWQVRRWIICALTYKGWRAPMWEAGRWTPLFFWDEAVALAAGHRPCALCRYSDFRRWMDGWETATGSRPKVDPVDRILHDERLGPDRAKRVHRLPWHDLPDGTFAAVNGAPHLVFGDRLIPWRAAAEAYGAPSARPRTGRATVLTPPSTVAVLRAGYEPVLHPSLVLGEARQIRVRVGGPTSGRR